MWQTDSLWKMHKTLFAEIKNMTGVKFVLSNAKVNLVIESFGDYNCEDIKARRAINSKKSCGNYYGSYYL